jgi:hypothetical protein
MFVDRSVTMLKSLGQMVINTLQGVDFTDTMCVYYGNNMDTCPVAWNKTAIGEDDL